MYEAYDQKATFNRDLPVRGGVRAEVVLGRAPVHRLVTFLGEPENQGPVFVHPEVLPDLGQLSEPPRVPQDPGLGLTLHVASELDPVS